MEWIPKECILKSKNLSLLMYNKQKLSSNFNAYYSVSTQLIQILGSLIPLAIFQINVTINVEKGVGTTTPHRAV